MKILQIFKFWARKSFIKNFFSLTIFQAIELFIPLLTIPIIIDRVGAEMFGLISFALVFCIFFQLIINFGFNTISVREVAIYSDNQKVLSNVFNDTVNSKLILSLFCFIPFCVIIFSIEKFSATPDIYLYTFISLLSQSLIPVWFFQGLQMSKYLTISSFVGKSIYLILILLFLKKESDYILVPIFNFIGYIITAGITIYVALIKYKITYHFITWNKFVKQLKMGKYMFLSEIKLYFISYFNIFLLGIISGNIAVAYFSGAEKILRAISNLFMPIQNSLFPILAVKLNSEREKAILLIKKIILYSGLFFLIFCTVLYVFSDWIVTIILGENMKESVIVFKILIFIPLLSFFDTLFGKQILLNLKKEKEFFRVVLCIALINFPLISFFTLKFSYIGTSISQVITQVLLALGMLYYSHTSLKQKS